jgi:hypothetical protein
VENTNSTILEVQGSFVLTYMVGIIPPNLRSQETNKGMPHERARAAAGRAGLGPWRGGRAGTIRVNLSVACLFVSCMRDSYPLAACPLACSMRPFSFSFPLREVKIEENPWHLVHENRTISESQPSHFRVTSERAGASGALAVRDLARGIDN